MAALESSKFVSFVLPPSKPLSRNSNPLWPAKTRRSLNTSGSQKIRRPATTFPPSGCHAEADRRTAARGGSRKRALANSDESDDDLPSLEEIFQTAPHSKISITASKTERTLQHVEQPALIGAGPQGHRTKLGLGERDSPDQPMILDDDESDETGTGDTAEGASGDVDAGRIGRDTSLRNTLATSELTSGQTKSIDASGPWYDVEEGCYIDEPTPRLGSCEQQGMPPAPTQEQPQILPQSSQPLQDQINQQGIDNITQSTSLESPPHHTFPKPSSEPSKSAGASGREEWWDIEDGRWVDDCGHPFPLVEQEDDSSSELEKDILLAFEEQEKSGLAATPSSPAPHRHSSQLLQDQENSQFQAENIRARTEEPRDATRVETLDEGEKEDSARQQAAEGGGKEGQDEEEEDVVGAVEETDMQRQQEHEEESELEGEDEELDELALEECLHNGEGEDGSDDSEDEDCDCDSIDEEYEGIRPAKRRRLPSPLSDEGLEDRGLHSARPDIKQLRRSPPTATERGHVRPKTMWTRARNSAADEQLHTPRPSRSPSGTEESELAAEYREWPFHGFLKSTRIGPNTTFNLEFHLADVPEHLELPAPFKALCNNDQPSTQFRIPHSTITHSKTRNLKSAPPRKRAPWTPEEDATLVKMREEENRSWEDISAALPSHSLGSIQVRYSTKFSRLSSGGARSRKRQRS